MKNVKILDFLVHGGNQYEFHKTGYEFYLTTPRGELPKWDTNDRPLLPNVRLISEHTAKQIKFDVVMVRSPVDIKKYDHYIRNGAVPIAAVQTTAPYKVPSQVKHVIWNSYDAMNKFKDSIYKGKSNHYIVHGFDPEEFKDMKLDRNNKVLTVANVYKGRKGIMGYESWDYVNSRIGDCDIIGHGNEDINPKIKKARDFKELISAYNKYSIFFNTTIESAMPRSRGEAAMCGMPIVSTDYYDIKLYFKDKKNILFANKKEDMISSIKLLLENKSMAEDMGHASRQVAIKYFNIKDNVEKWKNIIEGL